MILCVDLAAQQERLPSHIEAGIAGVPGHGQYILGPPKVAELEEQLVAYSGASFSISSANGTDALQIALMALGVGQSDEVIAPGYSYIATAGATLLLGTNVVYVDINPFSYNLDPALLEAAITPRIKAVIPVSLHSQPSDFDVINAIATRHDIPVIGDAEQSCGASHGGHKSANPSTSGFTSFFPSTPHSCDGEGGAIFTSDPELAKAIRQSSRHDPQKHYYHVRVGVNLRLDKLKAAILIRKLEILDEEIAARQCPADSDIPQSTRHNVSAWAPYTNQVANRSQVHGRLKEVVIPTAGFYPLPPNSQHAVADPPAEHKTAEQVFSISIHPYWMASSTLEIVTHLYTKQWH